MNIQYKGYSIKVEKDTQKRVGCTNFPISYSIFKDDEEIKSDSTYDFDSIRQIIPELKKFIDNGAKGVFCGSPYLVLN